LKALWRLKYLIPLQRKDAADSSLPGYAIVYFGIDTNVSEDTAASIFKAKEAEASSKPKKPKTTKRFIMSVPPAIYISGSIPV
jgi:hypothetical protein